MFKGTLPWVQCLIKILVSLGWHMVVPRAEVIESPKGLSYFLQVLFLGTESYSCLVWR